jgi:hypothetical protein
LLPEVFQNVLTNWDGLGKQHSNTTKLLGFLVPNISQRVQSIQMVQDKLEDRLQRAPKRPTTCIPKLFSKSFNLKLKQLRLLGFVKQGDVVKRNGEKITWGEA